MKKVTKVTPRDYNIVASIKREINISTRIIKNKKIYTRKAKHVKLAYS